MTPIEMLRARQAGKPPIVAHERCKHCRKVISPSPAGIWVDSLDYDVCDLSYANRKHEPESNA
jgi:hypothetical protein